MMCVCIEECDWLRLESFVVTSQLGLILIILKNHVRSYYWVGIIIGETRYQRAVKKGQRVVITYVIANLIRLKCAPI